MPPRVSVQFQHERDLPIQTISVKLGKKPGRGRVPGAFAIVGFARPGLALAAAAEDGSVPAFRKKNRKQIDFSA